MSDTCLREDCAALAPLPLPMPTPDAPLVPQVSRAPAPMVTFSAEPDGSANAQCGLSLQAAHAHQQLAGHSLAHLESQLLGLDAVVREEIRHTFTAECAALLEEVDRAKETLAGLRRTALRHFSFAGLLLAAVPTALALLILGRLLPSGTQLMTLRGQRAQLLLNIAQLTAQGGQIELHRCGRAQRLCVHVDRHASAYGEAADYFIVYGY